MYGKWRDKVILFQASKAVYTTKLQGWLGNSSLRHPMAQSSEACSYLLYPGMAQEPVPGGTYACHAYALKGSGSVSPNGWVPIGITFHHIVFKK